MVDTDTTRIASFRTLLSQGEITKEVSCEIPIPLPCHSDSAEYMAHIVSTQDVHPMFHQELLSTLELFIRREEEEMEEERDERVIEESIREGRSIDINRWNNALHKSETDSLSEAVSLADSFSRVMRECDPIRVDALMKRESEMATEVASLIRLRDSELDELRRKAEELMDKSNVMGGEELKELSRLNEEMRYTHESYVAELRMIGVRQRSEFKEMIRRLRTDPSYTPLTLSTTSDYDDNADGNVNNDERRNTMAKLEESFTIYLGAQLKTMHNARIVVGDEMGEERDDWNAPHVRLQASMGLYRRELTAVVLLVGRDPKWHILRRSKLARMCERSTELHFDSLESQLDTVAETALRANETRKIRDGDIERRGDSTLSIGDVYTTRHSNMGNVHIIYHLVVDEAEEQGDMNSRHPYLNGLRNIIRMASRFGVNALSLPILLTDTINEKTTLQWSAKRAELVFKCVKGYFMEICSTGWSSVSLGGASISRSPHYNINFILPSDIPHEIYSYILTLFPTIFHLVPSVTA